MTKQQLFDKVAKHLLTQKVASKSDDGLGRPVFFAKDGKMCALGCLMDKKIFREKIEEYDYPHENDMCPAEVLENFEECLPEGATENGEMLERLTYIHDGYSPDEWPDRIKWFTKEENLSLKGVRKWL